jgi:hypothetical protein
LEQGAGGVLHCGASSGDVVTERLPPTHSDQRGAPILGGGDERLFEPGQLSCHIWLVTNP